MGFFFIEQGQRVLRGRRVENHSHLCPYRVLITSVLIKNGCSTSKGVFTKNG